MADPKDNVRPSKSYEELMASARERAAKAQKSSKANDVVQLPIWPEPTRGVPNGVLRSALFGAVRKGARRYMEGEYVACVDGVEIRYTGQRLDQGDLDVWESVLHVMRLQSMDEQCRFTAYSLLKLMGKADTGSNRDTLHRRLLRLKANAVELNQSRFSYAGSLIDDVFREKDTHEYVVVLNSKLRPLFSVDQFTLVEWSVRRALDGHQLAQWLHGFYSSHAKPHPMRADTFHKLCGSEAVLMSDFKKDLLRALEAVAKASKACGQEFKYEICNNLIYVEKRGSGSQERHLAKKVTRSQRPRT